MTSRAIDPFKLLGDPSTWRPLGTGPHDAACEAERRAMRDFFLRRMAKGSRKGDAEIVGNIISAGSPAYAELFISACGGVDELPADAFDRYIAIVTFGWYQAVNHFNEGTAQ